MYFVVVLPFIIAGMIVYIPILCSADEKTAKEDLDAELKQGNAKNNQRLNSSQGAVFYGSPFQSIYSFTNIETMKTKGKTILIALFF